MLIYLRSIYCTPPVCSCQLSEDRARAGVSGGENGEGWVAGIGVHREVEIMMVPDRLARGAGL